MSTPDQTKQAPTASLIARGSPANLLKSTTIILPSYLTELERSVILNMRGGAAW